MNTQTPASAASMVARRFPYRCPGVSAAALLALCAVDASAQSWSNPDTTNPPGASQAWSIAGNWASGVPTSGTVNLYRTGNGAAYVLLDTETSLVSVVNVNRGSHLLIKDGGHLQASSRVDIGENTTSAVTVEAGGKVTSVGRLRLMNGSLLETAGVVSANAVELYSGGRVKMTGGTIDTQQTFSGVLLGTTADITSGSKATFEQEGGDLTTSSITINIGDYVVSGGKITTSGASGLFFTAPAGTGASTTLGSSFTVRGSAASINFNSYRNDHTGVDAVRPTFAFALDNRTNSVTGDKHISTINFSANGSSGATLRTNAKLDVSLADGVLFSDRSSHIIIHRATGATDTAWNNSASLNKLWVDTTSGDKTNITIGLNAAAFKGNLNVLGDDPLSFAAAAYGYATLAGAQNQSFALGLDIVGGDLNKFTTALEASGISWNYGSGAYEIVLNLTGTDSEEAQYFAWDFSTIDNAMSLQGLGLVTVPEPSAFAVFAGVGVLGAVVSRRRRA